MKKIIIVLLLLAGFSGDCDAQTFAEWFNQNATQKKYLFQQIAALQTYIGHLKKGYSVAKKGLTTISNIKNGHLSLDKDFFASLENINPAIQNYSKVADMARLNMEITAQIKRTMKDVKQSGAFTQNEISYMQHVFDDLIKGCTWLTDGLITVLTPGKLEMSDDERIKRINMLYADMEDRYVFTSGFCNDARLTGLQRNRDQEDTQITGILHGIQ